MPEGTRPRTEQVRLPGADDFNSNRQIFIDDPKRGLRPMTRTSHYKPPWLMAAVLFNLALWLVLGMIGWAVWMFRDWIFGKY